MKRIIAIVLCFVIILSGCAIPKEKENNDNVKTDEISLEFTGLNDEKLLSYVEDTVYQEAINSLDSDQYVVEEVQAVYISKEYLEEVAYNEQSNLYFGYTIDELNEYFQETKYIFTLGEDGETTVQALQEVAEVDNTKMLKNVAIGTGVILVCVVITVVSYGAGAPAAVTAIFAASAKTATTVALSSGAIGAASAGVMRGYQTGDVKEAFEAAAMAGSEGFKWGAFSGAVSGAGKEAWMLKKGTRFLDGTKNGLTMNDVAKIQRESKLPIDVISQMHSMDEYLIYKQAGLKTVMVNGKTALVPNIDLNYVSELPNGSKVTNLVRMQKGYAPLEPTTGKAYQLHHIGQKADGTLAVLTDLQHQGNSAILNIFGKESEINRSEFAKVRKEFWKYLGNEVFTKGGM